ncbi:helix-turn-helix domain-containing protein [Bacillus sp. N9]
MSKRAFISQSYLSDIENGRTAPSLDKLNSICETLGISLSEFFELCQSYPQKSFNLLKVLKVNSRGSKAIINLPRSNGFARLNFYYSLSLTIINV